MRRGKCRRGAVTVEFALVATLLFMIVFAGMEFARLNVARNTIENAAYEGARIGIVPGATSGECISGAQQYLDTIGINPASATVIVSPPTLNDTVKDITVTVSVTMDGSNGYVTPTFFFGKKLEATIKLPREV